MVDAFWARREFCAAECTLFTEPPVCKLTVDHEGDHDDTDARVRWAEPTRPGLWPRITSYRGLKRWSGGSAA